MKVVRTVLKVATFVGAIIGGPIGIGIAVAAGVGSSLLAKKPPAPGISPAQLDRLRANIDPRTPRKTVIGHTAMATDIRDEEFTDNQTYFHRFIVCASHKVHAIDEIWFDDELAWSSTGGVATKFSGYLTVATRTEGSAANAINISARMGSTRRYTGLAYVHLRYRLTGINNKVESPFASSITTRITIRGRGALIYDPRKDSLLPGGSGSHRANNQATWEWDADAARNPALALLFYLIGWRINDKLAIGRGIPLDRIDLPSFAVAANICDELVDKPGGGQEPRYRCDGIWSEGDNPLAVIDMLKATMNADLDDVDGRLRLTVFHNDLGTPAADFGPDDIIGAFEWDAGVDLSDSFNIVRGSFTDPSNESLYQMREYPEIAEPSPDGLDRIDTFDLPLVQSSGQGQRLAKLRSERQKLGGVFSADFQATAWKVQKNSIVRLTFPPRGFVNKIFRVAQMEIRPDGAVPLVLREETGTIYIPPTLTGPMVPISSVPYSRALDPLVQQINDLEQMVPVIPSLLPETRQVPSFANGGVTNYDGITTEMRLTAGPADISSDFTLSIESNPQGLTTSISGRTVTVTGAGSGTGQFGNEAVTSAELTIRATGSGAFAGIVLDRVFTLTKVRGGYEIVGTLPTTNLFEGRLVFLTTDDKLYRYTGTAWTKAVDGADITANSILTNSIGAGQVTAAKIAVTELSAITANIGEVTAGIARSASGNTVIDLNNARIIFTTGGFMKVTGIGFGSANQFLEWFGPAQSNLADCTEANAIQYLKTNGDAYFGGSLSAGILKNAGQTSLNTSDAQVVVGPFSTNGGTKTILLSYTYVETGLHGDPNDGTSTGSATIVLERSTNGTSWTQIGTLNVTLTATWNAAVAPFPGEFGRSGSGSTTVTDNTGATSTLYLRGRITSRSIPSVPSIVSSGANQNVSVVSTE